MGLWADRHWRRTTWLYAGAAFLLVLAGLLARLRRLDLMLYDFDEGVASIYALQLIERADFPLFGVRTSLGFYNPPMFIYLIAPAFAFCKSPLFAVGLLQVANVAAFAGVALYLYRDCWRWGVLIFLLFAMLSPGPLLLCRRLWGHALIPVFSCATFAVVLALARDRSRRWLWLLLPIIIAAAQQVHFSGALLLIDSAAVIALLRIRPDWKWLVAGCAIAFATYFPYLLFESRTGFADLKSVASTIASGAGAAEHRALGSAALFTLSDFGGATAFQHNYPKLLLRLPDFQFFRYAASCMFLAALIFAVRALRSSNFVVASRPLMVAALIWMIVPLLIFGILRIVIVPAYWLIALPAPWIVVGAAGEWIVRRTHRATTYVLAFSMVAAGCICFRYLRLHNLVMAQADPEMILYPSYRDQYFAIAMVCQDSAGRPVQLQQNNETDAIDYQLLYLLAMIEGNATRFRHSATEAAGLQHYLLNRRTRPTSAPANWAQVRFGMIDLCIEPLRKNPITERSLVFGPGMPASADPIMRRLYR